MTSPLPLESSRPAAADLKPAPIDPTWILSGAPRARCANLARSSDGESWTDHWDCTAGSFEWRYGLDETIHIVEGGATITDQSGRVWTVGAGDVVTFRPGTRARWVVPNYVRKIAFCRQPVSRSAGLLMAAQRRLRTRRGKAAVAVMTALFATTTMMVVAES
jgi:uncharacterized cupin superfamily protein